MHMTPLRRAFILTTLISLAVLPLHGAIPTARAASTYTVTTNTDSGTGSFRDALQNVIAAGGGIITFNAELPTIVLTTNLPVITVDMIIQANGATLQGSAEIRGLTITLGTVSIDRLTIRDGSCDKRCPFSITGGGGIYINDRALVTLSNSTLYNNSAKGYNGGGVYNRGTLTLINSTLYSNVVYWGNGGGIYNDSGLITLSGARLFGNVAATGLDSDAVSGDVNIYTSGLVGVGGGIYNYRGSMLLNHSTLVDNRAGFGGGIENSSMGILTINNSTLTGNSGFEGGAIYNQGMLLISTSTLSGNRGVINGGGIENDGTTAITSSVLANAATGGNCRLWSGTLIMANQTIADDATCSGNPIITAIPAVTQEPTPK